MCQSGSLKKQFPRRVKCARIRFGGASYEKMGRRLRRLGKAIKPPSKLDPEGRKEGLRAGWNCVQPKEDLDKSLEVLELKLATESPCASQHWIPVTLSHC